MTDIELIAESASRFAGFRQGTEKIIDLLRRLEDMPEISLGWTEGRVPLSADEDAFIDRIYSNQGSDVDEFDIYSLVAMAIKSKSTENCQGEPYVLRARYGAQSPLPTVIILNCLDPLTSLDFFRRMIGILLDWAPMQHIGISDMDYRFQFSPVDIQRRTVGWAGWVPFQLTADQVPEAYLIEPLRHGTFLACQDTWVPLDFPSIKRAQALDLRLNSLGVLPTLPELAGGEWGQAG